MTLTISKTTKDITTLADFVRRVEVKATPKTKVFLYRGHGAVGKVLRPKLFREQTHRPLERSLFREIISMHPSEFTDDRGVFEQLVRLQHFSLPTRLLDVTFNPLVALFFACWSEPETDGEFLRLTVSERALKYYDSDTVAAVSNLSNLSGKERDKVRKFTSNAQLAADPAGKRLLHFIKGEKPYFEPAIDLDDLRRVIPVKPRQTNRRMLAQQGAFLLFGLTTSLDDDNSFDITVERTTLPAASKPKLLRSLDRFNVNASTLFPEIESATKYLISKIADAGEHIQ